MRRSRPKAQSAAKVSVVDLLFESASYCASAVFRGDALSLYLAFEFCEECLHELCAALGFLAPAGSEHFRGE